jgi:hypothetical protein
MPAPLALIYPAFARVQDAGRRAEMTAQQLKQAEVQLITALKTQMISVALDISFYKEMLDANWEAQKEYQHASDYLYYLLTR